MRLLSRISLGIVAVAAASALGMSTAGTAHAAVPSFSIKNVNAGRCLGIASNGYAGIWDCTGNPDQTWHWGSQNPQYGYHLVNGKNQCLGVQGGAFVQGARLVGWTCLDHPDQYWGTSLFAGSTDGYAHEYLVNRYAENGRPAYLVAGVASSSKNNGAPVILWPANTHEDQDWLFR